MKLIGLTGGIATGKSLVTCELRRLGVRVLDADEIYHELLETSEELNEAIRREFGPAYFDADGRLDRRSLGRAVFGDPGALARLNAVTHPIVVGALRDRIDAITTTAAPGDVLFVSIPLLYEAGLDSMVGEVVLVWCPPEGQLARLMARNHLSREEASRRLESQWPLQRKRELAAHVIDNSGSVEQTLALVGRLLERLRAAPAGRAAQ